MIAKSKFVIVGATGLVGLEVVSILLERGVDIGDITLAASTRSVGRIIDFGEIRSTIVDANDLEFSNYKVAIFAVRAEVSRMLVPRAVKSGSYAIDNSSYFRMHDNVPLIVPEINFDHCDKNHKLIANPNCSTIQVVMALKPLHDIFGLKELVLSTYQSVSGAGQNGVTELQHQTERLHERREISPNCFHKQIAHNVIPQIDSLMDSLYTNEELKMMTETKKILNLDDSVEITATCVRVPVYVGHSVSVFAKFNRRIDLEQAILALQNFRGLKVNDGAEYTTPIESAGLNEVFVSRIRKHPMNANAISFWCVSDNIRKGAALNATQIALRLVT
jgi:aspartate-semialdehyde dehydrogenase